MGNVNLPAHLKGHLQESTAKKVTGYHLFSIDAVPIYRIEEFYK